MTDNYSYELTTSSYDEGSAAPAVSVRLGVNDTAAGNGRQSSVNFSSYSRAADNNNNTSDYYNYGSSSRNNYGASTTDCNESRPRSVIQETNYTTTTTTTTQAVSNISDVISEITNNKTKDNCNYLSEIEQAILRSNVPVEINESEEITALGQKGIWANRSEVVNWRGLIPIEQYVYNEDPNPEIITKRTQQKIEYIQELAVRYLRPPTPPLPGEIVIKQECNSLTPPAPPLIIRQQPPRPATPEPLVIREAPPQPPPQVNRRVITISGKRLPPPPRKVIIERLAPLPSKPQSAIIERWLPYSQVKRRVIYQRNCEQDPVACKPKNVIVQWEAPQVVVKKEVKYLGVIRANPAEYVQRFGSSLKLAKDLPQFVLDIKTPDGLVLAADYQYNNVHELEGDLQALKLVDLDREGLSEYRQQLQKIGVNYIGAEAARDFAANNSSLEVLSRLGGGGGSSTGNGLAQPSSYSVGFNNNGNGNGGYSSSGRGSVSAIADVFSQLDRDSNGRLSQDEARQLYLRLSSRLGRSQSDDDARQFVRSLAALSGSDGSISLSEFRRAFERLI